MVVLWIDDTKMGKRWLSTLTVLLREKVLPLAKDARLRIVGPHNSDRLVDALGEDLAAIAGEAERTRKAESTDDFARRIPQELGDIAAAATDQPVFDGIGG